MNISNTRHVLVGFALVFWSTPTLASEWGLGLASAIVQSPQKGIESEKLLVPYFTYQGERLNVDMGNLKYSLIERGAFVFSIAGELRYDGYKAKDSSALQGMENRDPSFDLGLSLAHSSGLGQLKLMLLSDVTGTHDGSEVRISLQKVYMFGSWMLAPALGLSYQNALLVEYYYGVSADESRENRPEYSGRDASNAFAEMSAVYQLSNKVQLLAGVKYVQFDSSITASSIVDQSQQTTAFTGLIYKF